MQGDCRFKLDYKRCHTVRTMVEEDPDSTVALGSTGKTLMSMLCRVMDASMWFPNCWLWSISSYKRNLLVYLNYRFFII
jgi:hypothetical protein